MNKAYSVDSGEVKVCQGDGVLLASAIGSCVAVTCYEGALCVGGMAHVMLPGASRDPNRSDRTKYAEDALSELVQKMSALGAGETGLHVCLVGGGNLLGSGHDNLGQEIVLSIVEILGRMGIEPAATDLGGTQRRSCTLDVACGRVTFTVGDSARRLLWAASDSGSDQAEKKVEFT